MSPVKEDPPLKPKIKSIRWELRREEELIELWDVEGVYRFDKESVKPFFSIDTPPPYASGPWHVAGAAHYAHIDMAARFFRMKGGKKVNGLWAGHLNPNILLILPLHISNPLLVIVDMDDLGIEIYPGENNPPVCTGFSQRSS